MRYLRYSAWALLLIVSFNIRAVVTEEKKGCRSPDSVAANLQEDKAAQAAAKRAAFQQQTNTFRSILKNEAILAVLIQNPEAYHSLISLIQNHKILAVLIQDPEAYESISTWSEEITTIVDEATNSSKLFVTTDKVDGLRDDSWSQAVGDTVPKFFDCLQQVSVYDSKLFKTKSQKQSQQQRLLLDIIKVILRQNCEDLDAKTSLDATAKIMNKLALIAYTTSFFLKFDPKQFKRIRSILNCESGAVLTAEDALRCKDVLCIEFVTVFKELASIIFKDSEISIERRVPLIGMNWNSPDSFRKFPIMILHNFVVVTIDGQKYALEPIHKRSLLEKNYHHNDESKSPILTRFTRLSFD